MKQFIYVLKQLTIHVQEDRTLNGNTFDLLSLIEIDEDAVARIRSEIKGKEVSSVDEFWDLTEAIYLNLMLKTIVPDLKEYFKKVQYAFAQPWLKIVYTFSPWDTFNLRLENETLQQEIGNPVSISMQQEHSENQIKRLLSFFHVEDNNWYQDLYDFDYAFNFQSKIESLFHDLAFSCWSAAKEETKSTHSGFIAEANGGSYVFSLDNEDNLHELNMSIEEYVNR